MQRLILSIPDDDDVDSFVSMVKQYVAPMPGTRVFDGEIIAHVLVKDDFDFSVIDTSWSILLHDNDAGVVTIPIKDVFLEYLADIPELDIDGNVVNSSRPMTIIIPHSFAGWNEIINKGVKTVIPLTHYDFRQRFPIMAQMAIDELEVYLEDDAVFSRICHKVVTDDINDYRNAIRTMFKNLYSRESSDIANIYINNQVVISAVGLLENAGVISDYDRDTVLDINTL